MIVAFVFLFAHSVHQFWVPKWLAEVPLPVILQTLRFCQNRAPNVAGALFSGITPTKNRLEERL